MARREHSRQELVSKLVSKGCPREIAESMRDQLEREQLLSEDRFVEALIQSRRDRGHGPLRIRHDLRQKGVSDSYINRRLDERDGGWLELLARVRRQKFGEALPGDFKERARQARFLQTRGFTPEQIRKVLKDSD